MPGPACQAEAWPLVRSLCVLSCAVAFIIGDLTSISKSISGGSAGSVNVSVWGTPDR